jgi:hypothetical protein
MAVTPFDVIVARMTGRFTICGVLALLGVAAPCSADPDPAAVDPLVERIREHDAQTELRKIGLLGLRLSSPQRLMGSLGVLWARQPADFDCTTGCDFRGPMLELEPGVAGAQVSFGYGIFVGDKGRNKFFVRRAYVGWALKGAYLRMWGNDSLEPEDQSFLGSEAQFTIAQVNMRLGVFRSLSSDPDDRWRVTGGLGWGF